MQKIFFYLHFLPSNLLLLTLTLPVCLLYSSVPNIEWVPHSPYIKLRVEGIFWLLVWNVINFLVHIWLIIWGILKSIFKREVAALWEKHAQLPAVDMLKVQGSLWCYSNLSPILIQPSLDAQSLCTLHSDCAKNLHMQTCGVWMAAWLEHSECQLQAVDQVFFAVLHPGAAVVRWFSRGTPQLACVWDFNLSPTNSVER